MRVARLGVQKREGGIEKGGKDRKAGTVKRENKCLSVGRMRVARLAVKEREGKEV